jgi:hypothetical protein
VTGWTPGAAVIERLLEERRLEHVRALTPTARLGSAAPANNGRRTRYRAGQPGSAFVLAYDAAR